ncbi:hypothetical protein BHM03_00041304 [Ensete ventricosum]|nr:hypothetical protein BHM03_00041304 [Ensete ventricosum]
MNCRTASGTFTDGDLRLNQRGLRLISEETQSSRVSLNSRLFSLLIQVEFVQDTSGCIWRRHMVSGSINWYQSIDRNLWGSTISYLSIDPRRSCCDSAAALVIIVATAIVVNVVVVAIVVISATLL